MTQFSEQSLWSWLLVFSFLFLSSNLSSELLLQLKCRSAIFVNFIAFFQQIGIYDYIHCYSFTSLHFLHLNLIKFQVFCDFLSLEAPDSPLPKSSCLLLVIINIIIFLLDPGPIIVRPMSATNLLTHDLVKALKDATLPDLDTHQTFMDIVMLEIS